MGWHFRAYSIKKSSFFETLLKYHQSSSTWNNIYIIYKEGLYLYFLYIMQSKLVHRML